MSADVTWCAYRSHFPLRDVTAADALGPVLAPDRRTAAERARARYGAGVVVLSELEAKSVSAPVTKRDAPRRSPHNRGPHV